MSKEDKFMSLKVHSNISATKDESNGDDIVKVIKEALDEALTPGTEGAITITAVHELLKEKFPNHKNPSQLRNRVYNYLKGTNVPYARCFADGSAAIARKDSKTYKEAVVQNEKLIKEKASKELEKEDFVKETPQ
jgi:hypothetical protein